MFLSYGGVNTITALFSVALGATNGRIDGHIADACVLSSIFIRSISAQRAATQNESAEGGWLARDELY